jgi:hypothetical protein
MLRGFSISAILFCIVSVALSGYVAQGADSKPADEKGFVTLFDGKTLEGWKGDTKGYVAEDGILKSQPGTGGNLLTTDEYSDFILRFEFKLTPGANNGLGIRLPAEGHPSYAGMELQILDDGDPKYKDLKPWQAHGSVYGIVPAKRGHLKPTGEWNEQEVIVKGRDIEVILNGETIVNANLDKASTPATIDGNDHPGVKRDRGFIGFLGHGDEVHFRNIRIKDLSK